VSDDLKDEGVIKLAGDTAIRCRRRDGVAVWQLCCPGCGTWADIDDDQFNGRVSVDHSLPLEGDDAGGCGYHEVRDFAAEVAEATA
jgi:hypothetical protein